MTKTPQSSISTMIIYLITNKINGKRYVGKTERSLEARWKEHLRAARKEDPDFYIARSIRRHGIENFVIEVIERCESDEALVEAERAWIKDLGTHGPGGYNLTDGGEGLTGWVATEEARKNMSIAAKNRATFSEEHRRKISIANSGKNNAFYGKAWGRKGPLSDEAKKKISIARTGKKLSEEHKTNISKGCKGLPGPNKGRVFKESERFNMSLSRSVPVDVMLNDQHLFTCFTVDDACTLFKPAGLSSRKMIKIVRNSDSLGTISFIKRQENIASLKLKNTQKG